MTADEPAAVSDAATGTQPVKLLRPTIAPAPALVTISALDDAPHAIGDFFAGGSPSVAVFNGGNPIVVGSAAAAGGTVGRQKFAENASPIPRDRVFFNYSYVNGAQLSARSTEVNRFVPGFEKTFRGGDLSFEFRAPFASTADSIFLSNGYVGQGELEWGDLTFFLKALLLYDGKTALTGGVGFSFPTHDDLVVRDELNGTPLINMDNTAIHALPYLAALWTPNDQLFVQLFGQIDVDLNGNDVTVAEPTGAGGSRFVHAGRLQDQTYLFLDLVAGYWIYQNPCSDFRGIAPVVELHFNRSLNDADFVFTSNGTGLSARDDDLSLLNTVVGVHMFVKDNLQVHAGYGFPLSGADDQFDGEFRVGMNWLFGPAAGGPFRRLR